MNTPPPRKPRARKPTTETSTTTTETTTTETTTTAPTQSSINRKQGIVNDLQGDHNDAVDSALRSPSDRQDIAEAQAGRRDDRRTEQFDAQAVTNAEAFDADAKRTVEFDAQAVMNADQLVTNETATAALLAIETAATKVTTLLEANAKRRSRWMSALAVVVLLIVVLGTLGFWRLKNVQDDASVQRRALAKTTARQVQLTAQLTKQADAFCSASLDRDLHYKAELKFLVDFAIGPKNPKKELRVFKAQYPQHLASTIPRVICEP